VKDKLVMKNIKVPRNTEISPVILMKVITREKLTSKKNTSQMNAEKKKKKKV